MDKYIYISQGLFLGYVLILTLIGGMKKDITHLIYTLPVKLRWITTAVYSICSGLFLYVAFHSVWYQAIFLTICALAFFTVGIFPDVRVKDKWKVKVHVGCAILAVLSGTIFSLLTQSWYMAVGFILFLLALKYKKITIKNSTYWVELFAFLIITISAAINEKSNKKVRK